MILQVAHWELWYDLQNIHVNFPGILHQNKRRLLQCFLQWVYHLCEPDHGTDEAPLRSSIQLTVQIYTEGSAQDMGGSRSRGGHSSAWLRCFGATFLQLVDEREETLIWTEEFCCEIHKGVGWDWELAFVKLPLGWECRQNKDELQQHFRMRSLPPKGFLYILKHTAAPVKLFLLATQIRQETSPLKHELKRKLTIT